MTRVLLVEDDPGDILIIREAFAANPFGCQLEVVQDGRSALDFLHRRGRFVNAPIPELILLDLNLPGMDGRRVLAEVKAEPGLRQIPLVVLTISESAEDVLASYELHANAFVAKPGNVEQFLEAVRAIDEFFSGIARLPRG